MDFKRDRNIIQEAIKHGYKTVAQLALYIKMQEEVLLKQ
jgi:hypothetical protein